MAAKETDGKKEKKDKKLKKHRFGNGNGEASTIKRRRLLKPQARPEAKSTKVYGHEVPKIGGTMVSDGEDDAGDITAEMENMQGWDSELARELGIRSPARGEESSLFATLDGNCMDDLNLAIALSLSELPANHIPACGASDAEEISVSAATAHSLDLAKRCFICGVHTINPLRLRDPECMHIACSLEHLHRLHPVWLDIKSELLQLDASLTG